MTGITQDRDRTLVLGIGNPLCGDDGLGPRAVELLAAGGLPQGVVAQEAGTPGFGLVSWMEGWNRVILVDAVKMGLPPGSWRRLDGLDLNPLAIADPLSLHEPDLANGLALAQALDMMPEQLTIYAVEPAGIEPGRKLSTAVRSVLPEIVEKILEEL
jgi:hydrogenase maturation protease